MRRWTAIAVALATLVLTSAVTPSEAMDFEQEKEPFTTIRMSGKIVAGDAAKFRALVDSIGGSVDLIELDSPGGLVNEAFPIAAVIDEVQKRTGRVGAVIRRDAVCASACAMIIYITANRHTVEPGGKLGIHSCKSPNGTNELCNAAIAQHALRHGTATRAIANFAGIAGPGDMIWLSSDDAECWGLVKNTDAQPGDDCAERAIRGAFKALMSPPQKSSSQVLPAATSSSVRALTAPYANPAPWPEPGANPTHYRAGTQCDKASAALGYCPQKH